MFLLSSFRQLSSRLIQCPAKYQARRSYFLSQFLKRNLWSHIVHPWTRHVPLLDFTARDITLLSFQGCLECRLVLDAVRAAQSASCPLMSRYDHTWAQDLITLHANPTRLERLNALSYIVNAL